MDVRCWLPSRSCIFKTSVQGRLLGFLNPTQLWVGRPVCFSVFGSVSRRRADLCVLHRAATAERQDVQCTGEI